MLRVSGPLVEVDGLAGVAMSELVALGPEPLPGEVVAIRGRGRVGPGLRVHRRPRASGDPVAALGRPLSARLGPGLLGGVFDGLLRPLATAPTWLVPGAPRDRAHRRVGLVARVVAEGDRGDRGSVLGTVPGAGGIEHRVLVPPGVAGTVERARAGRACGPDDVVATVGGRRRPR